MEKTYLGKNCFKFEFLEFKHNEKKHHEMKWKSKKGEVLKNSKIEVGIQREKKTPKEYKKKQRGGNEDFLHGTQFQNKMSHKHIEEVARSFQKERKENKERKKI